MKFAYSLLVAVGAVSLSLFLSSCGNSSGQKIIVAKTKGFNPNHGPFDSKGNYVEAWADSPPRRIYVDSDKVKNTEVAYAPIPKPEPTVVTPPPIAYTPPVTRPTRIYTPKEHPIITKKAPKKTVKRPVAVKVRPKAKAPIIHIVKKGDTLYGLGNRYKSSVKTIMSANSLKGTNIRIGQKLRIPRY